MKFLFASILMVSMAAVAANKGNQGDKEKLVKQMVTACKTELAKDPALTDTTDSEAVWKNLEDKEHGDVKLSKKCDNAHEKYEHKFHKGEENEQSESK